MKTFIYYTEQYVKFWMKMISWQWQYHLFLELSWSSYYFWTCWVIHFLNTSYKSMAVSWQRILRYNWMKVTFLKCVDSTPYEANALKICLFNLKNFRSSELADYWNLCQVCKYQAKFLRYCRKNIRLDYMCNQ